MGHTNLIIGEILIALGIFSIVNAFKQREEMWMFGGSLCCVAGVVVILIAMYKKEKNSLVYLITNIGLTLIACTILLVGFRLSQTSLILLGAMSMAFTALTTNLAYFSKEVNKAMS